MGFKQKTKRCMSAAQIESLPPTLEAFKENTKRAHFQVCIWKAALDEQPPYLVTLQFGWYKDDLAKSLHAVSLPHNVLLAPAKVLKMKNLHTQQ